MDARARGVACGVVEWVKFNTLRWFEHVQRMQGLEFVKRCVSVREGLDRTRRECLDTQVD